MKLEKQMVNMYSGITVDEYIVYIHTHEYVCLYKNRKLHDRIWARLFLTWGEEAAVPGQTRFTFSLYIFILFTFTVYHEHLFLS